MPVYMTLLYSQYHHGVLYQVEQSQGLLRLLTDGIFHSERPLTGMLSRSVWDLLSLPSLYLDELSVRRPLRLLVLGLGAGVVCYQLQRLVEIERLVAIELDALHIRLAQNFFNAQEDCDAIYHGDAKAWLAAYSGPGFDLIIDDLFIVEGEDAQRAFAFDSQWQRLLYRRLNPHGLVVANFADQAELERVWQGDQSAYYLFEQAQSLSCNDCFNRVGVFYKGFSSPSSIEALIAGQAYGAQVLDSLAWSSLNLRQKDLA